MSRLARRAPGSALDLGAGEGSDAIRLARLGYEVDAVEASSVGAEKIARFGREAGVGVRILNEDARSYRPCRRYDVVICSGLLHYLEPEQQILVIARLKEATAPGGLSLVTTFSDYSPIPDCHGVVDVFADSEDGVVVSSYREWIVSKNLARDKAETAHRDFPPHRHSFVKILAECPEGR